LPCWPRAPGKIDVEVLGFEVEDGRLWRGQGPLGSFDYIQTLQASESCTKKSMFSGGMSLVISDRYHVIHISPFASNILLLLAALVESQKSHHDIY
jgi:hypothetical protein